VRCPEAALGGAATPWRFSQMRSVEGDRSATRAAVPLRIRGFAAGSSTVVGGVISKALAGRSETTVVTEVFFIDTVLKRKYRLKDHYRRFINVS
jgi:hypothetical protein